MILKLKRIHFNPEYTIGKLSINGKYFSDILEDKNEDINKNGKFDNGEKKVYGHTCIPFGTYEITLAYSPKFKRVLPKLLKVPSFKGILIHRGNTSKDTAGCLLPGENSVKGRVINSTIYEIKLVKLIRQALLMNDKVYITIS